jgi:hypothetical protein
LNFVKVNGQSRKDKAETPKVVKVKESKGCVALLNKDKSPIKELCLFI